jgi:hypothetical protein
LGGDSIVAGSVPSDGVKVCQRSPQPPNLHICGTCASLLLAKRTCPHRLP